MEVVDLTNTSDDEENGKKQIYHFAEFYSPPCIVPMCCHLGLTANTSLDILNGHDLRQASARLVALELLDEPCRMFSTMQNSNRRHFTEERWAREMAEAQGMLGFALLMAKKQYQRGRYFVLEHPHGAQSWNEPQVTTML